MTVSTVPPEAEPGYTIGTFTKAVQDQFVAEYRKKYAKTNATADALRPQKEDKYVPPEDHDAHREHHRAFLDSVRQRKPSIEDGVFGLRAAGPALLTNRAYFDKRICQWDPQTMTAS